MESTLPNFKVQIGALVLILTISLGDTAYISPYDLDSGDNFGSPYYNYKFESRKTNQLKRQADDYNLQRLDEEPTEEPKTDLDIQDPANYDFEYKIHGGGNFLGHSESRRDTETKGSYHALLPDGRMQIVSYYADETGYHPTIKYEIVDPRNKNPKPIEINTPSAHHSVEVETTTNKLRKRYARIVKRIRSRSSSPNNDNIRRLISRRHV